MTKKIEAFIHEEKLNGVKKALRDIGIVGMNVVNVRGCGRDGGIELAGRSGTYKIDMLHRIQLNIVLSDHNVEKTVATICSAARNGSGKEGDGLIFIYPVEDIIRISTGERGHEAIMYDNDIDARGKQTHQPAKTDAA